MNTKKAGGDHYRTRGKDVVTRLYEENMADGHGFCYGNILKYTERLYRKGDTVQERNNIAQEDLYKIATYAILMLNHEFDHHFKIVEEKEDVES